MEQKAELEQVNLQHATLVEHYQDVEQAVTEACSMVLALAIPMYLLALLHFVTFDGWRADGSIVSCFMKAHRGQFPFLFNFPYNPRISPFSQDSCTLFLFK